MHQLRRPPISPSRLRSAASNAALTTAASGLRTRIGTTAGKTSSDEILVEQIAAGSKPCTSGLASAGACGTAAGLSSRVLHTQHPRRWIKAAGRAWKSCPAVSAGHRCAGRWKRQNSAPTPSSRIPPGNLRIGTLRRHFAGLTLRKRPFCGQLSRTSTRFY